MANVSQKDNIAQLLRAQNVMARALLVMLGEISWGYQQEGKLQEAMALQNLLMELTLVAVKPTNALVASWGDTNVTEDDVVEVMREVMGPEATEAALEAYRNEKKELS